MKKSILLVALSLCSLSAFAGPAETSVKGPSALQLTASLQGKKLVCTPADIQLNDAGFFPITVTAAKDPSGTAVISVANAQGDDGLSNCSCSRGTYRNDTLRLLDGDDDNYRDLILSVSSGDLRLGATVHGLYRDLDDSFKPADSRNLVCVVEKN